MLGFAPIQTDHPAALPEKYQRWPRMSIAILAHSELERSRQIIKGRGNELDLDAHEALKTASQLFPVERDPCKNADEPYTITERLTESLCNSCRVVITLFRCSRDSLGRGAEMRLTANASRIIKLAMRLTRDLVTWRAIGLGPLVNINDTLTSSDEFLQLLSVPFNGTLSDHTDGPDPPGMHSVPFSKELKSQLLLAWRKLREDIGLEPTELTAGQKKRRAKKPPIKTTTHQRQPDLDQYDWMGHDFVWNGWPSPFWDPSMPVPLWPMPCGEMFAPDISESSWQTMMVPEEKSEAMVFHGGQCTHDAMQVNPYDEVLVNDLIAARQREEQLVAELTEASLIRAQLTEAALGYQRQLQAMRDEYNTLRDEYTTEVHEVQRTRSNAAEVEDTLRRELQDAADSQFMTARGAEPCPSEFFGFVGSECKYCHWPRLIRAATGACPSCWLAQVDSDEWPSESKSGKPSAPAHPGHFG